MLTILAPQERKIKKKYDFVFVSVFVRGNFSYYLLCFSLV